MKASAVIFSVATLLALVNFSTIDAAITLNFNKILDKILADFKGNAAQNGLNPYAVQDIQEEFKVVFIKGHVNLDNGKIWGINTISRNGDSTATLQVGAATVTANLFFQDLTYDFNFKAQLGLLKPSGEVGGDIKDLSLRLVLLANMKNTSDITVSLQQFSLTNVGSITLKLKSGNNVEKAIVNAILSGITRVFKNNIVQLLQKDVGNALQASVKKIHFNLNEL